MKNKKYLLILFISLLMVAITVFLIYKEKTDYWVVTSYADASGNQGMFYTIYNRFDHTLIVVDGGWSENTEGVRKTIRNLGGTVDAWFITHYHNDHVDAFNNIYEDPQEITIKQVYDSPINYDKYIEVAHEWDFPESFEKYLDVTRGADNVTHLSEGDSFDINGLHISVFNSYGDTVLNNGSGDIPNNASLVFKIVGEEDSILFCADCHSETMADYFMKNYTEEELHAEYVQLGHHGNNSFPTYFYDYVKPEVVLFDAPDWLMTGEDYTARELEQYFEKQGISCYDYRTAPNQFVFK